MLGYYELYGGQNVTKILLRSSAISGRNISSTLCIRIVVFDTIVWSGFSCVGSCTTPVCLRKNSKQDCPRSLLQNPHSRVLRRCEPQPHRRRVAVYLVTHFIWSKGGTKRPCFCSHCATAIIGSDIQLYEHLPVQHRRMLDPNPSIADPSPFQRVKLWLENPNDSCQSTHRSGP